MPVQPRLIQQAYVFALDPTPGQEQMFASHAGGARYAYNWGIAYTITALDAYQAAKDAGLEPPQVRRPKHFDLCAAWTKYKDAHGETPDAMGRTTGWVGENFSGTYQAALRDAATAWNNFFDSRAGRRKGRHMGRPKFKTRRSARVCFQVHGETLQVVDAHHIKLPKIGVVKTHESTRKLLRRLRKPEVTCPPCAGQGTITELDTKTEQPKTVKCTACGGKRKKDVERGTGRIPVAHIVRGTVSRTSRGRWRISLTVQTVRDIRTAPSARQRAGGLIGIDLGTRDLITTSDGRAYPAPAHLAQAMRKLRRLNQALSRAQDGSQRRDKARKRLSRAHGRIADLRLDHIHKITSGLVHNHSGIVVEGFNLTRLAQYGGGDKLPKHIRRRRNRQLADASPGQARWQLQSKGAWYGCDVTVWAPNEATGRTCSACGQVKTKPVTPDTELFTCPACGHTSDRRVNTARVLARRPQHVAPSGGETQNARGEDVRPKEPGSARGRGRSPAKREARSSTRKRGQQTGTPGP